MIGRSTTLASHAWIWGLYFASTIRICATPAVSIRWGILACTRMKLGQRFGCLSTCLLPSCFSLSGLDAESVYLQFRRQLSARPAGNLWVWTPGEMARSDAVQLEMTVDVKNTPKASTAIELIFCHQPDEQNTRV